MLFRGISFVSAFAVRSTFPSCCLPSAVSRTLSSFSLSPYKPRHHQQYPSIKASSSSSDTHVASMPSLSSTTNTFASAKDARSFVSQSVIDAIEEVDASVISVVKSGELACQRDSYQTTLDGTTPVSFAVFEEGPAKSKKKGGKKNKGKGDNKQSADAANNDAYNKQQIAIALSDSILYPEGGGQPCDTGKIFIVSSSSSSTIELIVKEVNSINQICILTCAVPKSIDVQQVMEALQADGTSVRQTLDWDRRFDLMTQHSAQHLISAVALSDPFGMNTHSFSLSTKSLISYVDFVVDTDIDTDALRANLKNIEDLVNQNIRLNLPMTPRYLDQAELAKSKESGEIRSRLLPEGITGKIRLVEIGEGNSVVDQNTCGGTHVPALGQLQMIKFFKLDRMKSNIMRVYFAAGNRLLNIMSESYERQAALTTMMSSTEEEIVDRVAALVNDKREQGREIQGLNERLCEFQAKEIVEELKANDMVAAVDVGSCDMSFKTALSSAVAERCGTMDGALLLLVGGSESGDDGSFLLTGDVALVDKTGKLIAEALGGRGGGRGSKYQGKGNKIRSGLDEACKLMGGGQ